MNIFWKIILVLVGIFVALTLLGLFGPKVASFWRDYQYGVGVRQAEEMAKAIETAYKNDVIGGKTPEETFDMFIVALKAGNTLQASKYYELSVQPKALNSLQGELAKYGNLQKSIDYFTEVRTKGVKQCNERGDGCVWEYRYKTTVASSIASDNLGNRIVIPAGEESTKFIDIAVNSRSGVWKITQPF